MNIHGIICRFCRHKWTIVKDSGIGDATAGGCTGDSYLDGNEEALDNFADEHGNPIRTPLMAKARKVHDRHVTVVCSRCKRKDDVGRWCELGDEDKLSDQAMFEQADWHEEIERECDI